MGSMGPPAERVPSSLERQPMPGGLGPGPEEMKSSMDRQTRTSLERHRQAQAQERLGSMERGDEGRRGHKTGTWRPPIRTSQGVRTGTGGVELRFPCPGH